MSYETLLLAVDKGIATITINRPDKRNALNAQVRGEIIAVLDLLRDDDSARVIVFNGAGDKAFVGGADVAEFAERTPEEQREIMEQRRVYDEVAEYPKPTIAMINGFALGGGCELALACDIRIAARSAKLGQPEIKLGIIPGGGATQRLPRLVGTGQALRLILTGDMVSGEDAEQIGLVDIVTADEALEQNTRDLALRIAAQSPLTLQLAKQAIRAAAELPLAEGLKLERQLFMDAFSSEDGREGIRAFIEKRAPIFKGS